MSFLRFLFLNGKYNLKEAIANEQKLTTDLIETAAAGYREVVAPLMQIVSIMEESNQQIDHEQVNQKLKEVMTDFANYDQKVAKIIAEKRRLHEQRNR